LVRTRKLEHMKTAVQGVETADTTELIPQILRLKASATPFRSEQIRINTNKPNEKAPRHTGQSGWGFKPLYLINSYLDDPTAYHQIVTMSCELEAQGLVLDTDYKRLTKPGDGHAFAYWGAQDPATGETIGQYVIEFLDAHLQ
jgi:hypothetical protein